MRILYGVPSEGMGHATRSKVVVQHLLDQGHDVRIATSDRAHTFLEQSFPGRTFKIEGFHLKYDQGTVSKWASFKLLLKSAPESLKTNLEQFRKVNRDFHPEVIISDFESFTYYFAKVHGLPLVSVDNMQVINRCQLDISVPDAERESYLLAKGIIKAKVPYCDRYLVSAFFQATPCKKNTEIITPILRDKILQAKESRKDHILVYQTSSSQDDMVPGLQSVWREKFLVYGFNRDEGHGNVQLKKFSEDGFIEDLASCKGVITNGGYSLISEAVYLHKPILSFPIGGQFEQFLNGAQVERMGYGRRHETFHSDHVKSFLYDLEKFQEKVATYAQDGNKSTFEAIDRFLASPEVQEELDEEED
ncbi:MAG: UDP-glucuronosyltransferase [Fibrobacterota bacterium]|nr:MAG: UDP-glucuronosyltransferase [Fibrobacterota bacterium]